jgi:hypothetical protein
MYAKLRSTPAPLRKRCAVHIRVEANRDVQAPTQTPDDVSVAPPRLHGRGDVSVRWRRGLEIERTERGKAEGTDRSKPRTPALEYRLDLREGGFRAAGWHPLLRTNVSRAVPQDAYALRSAQLHTRQQFR